MKIPTVEFVETIISKAAANGASDIHIDPYPDASSVRFRIDGLLRPICTIPAAVHPEVIARIKILAHARTDVHHTPQDGRFRHVASDIKENKPAETDMETDIDCDVRVAILPTQHGENAVLRILNNTKGKSSLDQLGFTVDDIARVDKALARHQGLILVTGPTGSGKTTTLYSLIEKVNRPEVAIVSLEDPIEYGIPGIRQVQVNVRHGITFATGLRAILRQDPNIIVVGEIRDAETAEIAIHSALTGHLVLSTLHTNSACAAIPRLVDMGLQPYLISATLSLVIGQRLVRKLAGKGRIGIYETLLVDENMRLAITQHGSGGVDSSNIIFDRARGAGMHTMYEDGQAKVKEGLTTKEEMLRVLFE
ncbi:MAG: GspE/PulE family protein [bacterium]